MLFIIIKLVTSNQAQCCSSLQLDYRPRRYFRLDFHVREDIVSASQLLLAVSESAPFALRKGAPRVNLTTANVISSQRSLGCYHHDIEQKKEPTFCKSHPFSDAVFSNFVHFELPTKKIIPITTPLFCFHR